MSLQEPNAETAALAERIHQVLPQTQCRRCGQPDCAAYAQAIAQGEAPINQCPPGGRAGIIRIAQAIGRPGLARGLDIDPACGREGPMAIAVIDENWCIGCTLCIKACPTDAIVGGRKRMHTVQAEYCTGCELCVLACPVDCIAMEPVCTADEKGSGVWQSGWSQPQADQALQRYTKRQLREQTSRNASAVKPPAVQTGGLEAIAVASSTEPTGKEVAEAAPATVEQARKRAMIEAALARARRARQVRT